VHAVAMFLPGLITGDIIKRTSCATVMGVGCFLYASFIVIALAGQTTAHFVVVREAPSSPPPLLPSSPPPLLPVSRKPCLVGY
jgi:hypothetical protein